MRISDWSSDVCSSDLVLIASRHGSDIACAIAAAYIVRSKHLTMEEAMRYIMNARPSAKYDVLDVERLSSVIDPCYFGEQIVQAISQLGRAACRERVCQYV